MSTRPHGGWGGSKGVERGERKCLYAPTHWQVRTGHREREREVSTTLALLAASRNSRATWVLKKQHCESLTGCCALNVWCSLLLLCSFLFLGPMYCYYLAAFPADVWQFYSLRYLRARASVWALCSLSARGLEAPGICGLLLLNSPCAHRLYRKVFIYSGGWWRFYETWEIMVCCDEFQTHTSTYLVYCLQKK